MGLIGTEGAEKGWWGRAIKRVVTIDVLNTKASVETTSAEIKMEQVTGFEPATFSLGS